MLNFDFSKYYDPEIKSLSSDISDALRISPIDKQYFIPFEKAIQLNLPGYFEVENGYCLNDDSSAHISVLTKMPGVSPQMWHWWFGWHCDDTKKYKLWHPKAHLSSKWKDEKKGELSYVNRISLITEYIGKKKESIAIQFKNPTQIQLPEFTQNSKSDLFIVARIGLKNIPINIGWLIHQVRPTSEGAEMRSRFWLGGPYISIGTNIIFKNALERIIRSVRKIPESMARNLLIHCSEEMNHLAHFLPDLYSDYHSHRSISE
jgi:hypothetical protein